VNPPATLSDTKGACSEACPLRLPEDDGASYCAAASSVAGGRTGGMIGSSG
jgi:hypothetical protein